MKHVSWATPDVAATTDINVLARTVWEHAVDRRALLAAVFGDPGDPSEEKGAPMTTEVFDRIFSGSRASGLR